MSGPSEPAIAVDTNEESGQRFYTYPITKERFPSTTTVTSATEDSSFFIARWKQRLATQVTLDNAVKLAEMRGLYGPPTGKDAKHGAWIGSVEAVKWVAAEVDKLAAIKADAGKHVHAVVEALTLWAASPDGAGGDIAIPDLPENLVGALYDDEPIEDVIDAMVTGFMNFVIDFRPKFLSTEMVVFNPQLKIAGTLDARIELHDVDVDDDGKLFYSPGHVLTVTIDLKSGRHKKWTWVEQVETYRRMPLAFVEGGLETLEPTQAAAVLHCRAEFVRGYQIRFLSKADQIKAWNTFRHALHTFNGRDGASDKIGPLGRPLVAPGRFAPMLLADLGGEVSGRVLNPLLRALGPDSTVDDVASFTEPELLAIKYIGPKSMVTIADMVEQYATRELAEVA